MEKEKLFDIAYQIKRELKVYQIPPELALNIQFITDIVIILDKLNLLKEE